MEMEVDKSSNPPQETAKRSQYISLDRLSILVCDWWTQIRFFKPWSKYDFYVYPPYIGKVQKNSLRVHLIYNENRRVVSNSEIGFLNSRETFMRGMTTGGWTDKKGLQFSSNPCIMILTSLHFEAKASKFDWRYEGGCISEHEHKRHPRFT